MLKAEYKGFQCVDGSTLHYFVARPEDFEPHEVLPGVFVLPPGSQTRDRTEAALEVVMEKLGGHRCCVFSPVAPEGVLFCEGSERYLPDFLEYVLKEYAVEGGTLSLFGVENGGISAFRIGCMEPGLFHSLTVMPGCPRDQDLTRLSDLRDLPVWLYAGANDRQWVERGRFALRALQQAGVNAKLEVVPDEDHDILSDFDEFRLRGLLLIKFT